MKKIIILVLLLWSNYSQAQIKSATLTASGLTCSMCSKAIYKALEKLPFIATIDANVEKSSYDITFKNNATVNIDALKDAVEDAGFSVASLLITATFANQAVANDAHITLGGSNFHFLNVTKQSLNGDKSIRLLDKSFVTAKEHKKYAKYTRMKCYETGKMEACCAKNGSLSERIYHVTF